ncbi:MAG: hypothetical protein ACREMD_10355 [Gemmatimonadota bacterium]
MIPLAAPEAIRFGVTAPEILASLSCEQGPVVPEETVESGRRLSLAQTPEEEILGGIFKDASPDVAVEGTVRLTALGAGACIFNANTPSSCSDVATMPIMAQRGSVAVSFSNHILEIDNPRTDSLFAQGDTVVFENDPVRFDTPVTTGWSLPIRVDLPESCFHLDQQS